jgi:hypothetical protein
MARFPRTLGDALAAQAEVARTTRTEALSVDALAPITTEHLDSELATNLETLQTDSQTLKEDMALVDDKIQGAISDANAIPITNDRFTEDSLSIWPFIQGLIPNGAMAPGAVGASDLADFVLTARKFNDDRHRLY